MKVSKIWFENEKIGITTDDGREASMPLEWFPELANATQEQRYNYELSPLGIHWEELDEDLSFEGFFKFNKNHQKV